MEGYVIFQICETFCTLSNPFTISEGPFYEMRLEEFLNENPEKSKEDFPHVEVSYAGARILLPAGYVCEWTFRCPVLDIEYTELMRTRFAKISTEFVGLGDEVIRGFLYASEHVLNGYDPQPGDDVEGVLWMTGILQDGNLTDRGEDDSLCRPVHESEEEISAKKLSQAMLGYMKKRTVAEIATIYAEIVILNRKNTSSLSQLDFLNLANKYHEDGKIGASVAYKVQALRLFCSGFASVAADLGELDHMFFNVDAMCKKEIGLDWLEKVISERIAR